MYLDPATDPAANLVAVLAYEIGARAFHQGRRPDKTELRTLLSKVTQDLPGPLIGAYYQLGRSYVSYGQKHHFVVVLDVCPVCGIDVGARNERHALIKTLMYC